MTQRQPQRRIDDRSTAIHLPDILPIKRPSHSHLTTGQRLITGVTSLQLGIGILFGTTIGNMLITATVCTAPRTVTQEVRR